MADTEALFGLLRQTAHPAVVDALKRSGRWQEGSK